MNTPRLRSGFPSTPSSDKKYSKQDGKIMGTQGTSSPLPKTTEPGDNSQAPMIPYNVLDAPTQRLYVLGFYIAFTTWRFYDYFKLVSDETDSLWLFMKWVSMDSVFLYGLPGLRVPWLQWSSTTMTLLFVIHAIMNALLMFRIPIPLISWLMGLTKLLYDRELSVSERRVKPASILHNSSLILGKQIVHILPEGSAMLNPDQIAFCIGSSTSSINLPIRINQTNPILIELLRVDLDTNSNETITIMAKEIKKLKKRAERENVWDHRTSPLQLQYPVKASGLYRLQRVVDESKLEVQRRVSDTLVVHCPKAYVKSVGLDKCKGDLSDFYLQVEGTPPLKIKYSKMVNGENTGKATLSIHPENLVSPLLQQTTSGALVSLDPSAGIDLSWARSQAIQSPLNESLGTTGGFRYSIDEVQDACGNTVKYASSGSVEPSQPEYSTSGQLEQIFNVHKRPRVGFYRCDSQHPIMVAKRKPALLQLQYDPLGPPGPDRFDHDSHTVSYKFTPQDKILSNQQHGKDSTEIVIKNSVHGPQIVEPGLYTLVSVKNQWCSGEVMEPSSCLLINPPEPSLEMRFSDIPDRCAGNAVGLLVDLDLTGTPPFRVRYSMHRDGERDTKQNLEVIEHLHSQLILKPPKAGHYIYEFDRINDAVYQEARVLEPGKFRLEQDVKPPASARFGEADLNIKACIEEPISLSVQFSGEPPWSLEYAVIHNGKATKHKAHDLQSNDYQLTTEKLTKGGEYIIALISIKDSSGCKISLQEEAKIDVSLQRPRASFGQLEGKRKVSALEGKKIELPLKLQGERPWYVKYRNVKDPEGKVMSKGLGSPNAEIEVDVEGTYEIFDVKDSRCPGSVDKKAATFEVSWIPRPGMDIAESVSVTKPHDGSNFVKNDVCEGVEDAAEITFTGTPPFSFEYNQRFKTDHGSENLNVKKFTAGLRIDSLKMDTSQPGFYEYTFTKLSDGFYPHDPAKHRGMVVEQQVHPKPLARFSDAGKTYRYCKEEEAGDEVIPIVLAGLPPFQLEIEIKHHGTTKPELVPIAIHSNEYNFHIPHRVLGLGTHAVKIRKVRDARNCEREMASEAPHVQVSVADIPGIAPLEAQTDYCVGDRISYSLSGTPPFNVFYTFQGRDKKASAPTTNFRRIAEKPGEFTITSISDQRSTDACKARVDITKVIHEMPSVRVSKGKTATIDIHEGGEAEILFEFGGTPPFVFTYTRSTHATKGKKSVVLETKSETSHAYAMTVRASDEGVYEVVSIKDKYCAFSSQKGEGRIGQRLLTY